MSNFSQDNANSSLKPANLHEGHRERLKQRFLKQDMNTFNDHQLLELLLFYLIPRRDTNPLAHTLMNHFGSLSGVLHATPQELMQVKGVGPSTAHFFSLLCELERRSQLELHNDVKCLETLNDVRAYLQPFFHGVHQEVVYLLCGNARNKVLGCDLLSSGNDLSVAFDTHLLVQKALLHKATWVVLAHNHPSGFAQPSHDDIRTTRHCKQLLDSLGIKLRDHIVFADGEFVSMTQSKIL